MIGFFWRKRLFCFQMRAVLIFLFLCVIMIGSLLEEAVILSSDWVVNGERRFRSSFFCVVIGYSLSIVIFDFVCDYDWFFIGGSSYFVFRLGR